MVLLVGARWVRATVQQPDLPQVVKGDIEPDVPGYFFREVVAGRRPSLRQLWILERAVQKREMLGGMPKVLDPPSPEWGRTSCDKVRIK
jgi:hypothetical protein